MNSSKLRFGFTHLLPALPIALVMTVAAPAQAVISNFTLTGASPLNTPAPSYTETVNGITLTVNNATGTDLPTAGGISGNPQGLCTWLQNSATTQRCGFNTGTGATTNSQLSSLSFTFDKPVYLKDFFIQLNDISSADINFSGGISTTLAGITSSSTQSLADVILPANTPIIFAAQNVIPSAGFDSTALRMRNFNVEEVPGPLPFLGVGAAFSMTRKLRRYSARSQA